MPFLPLTKREMEERGWRDADIIIVTGDAYVDHPSFGTAIISRVLEKAGYRVCIISQPRADEDYKRFGKPKLAFYVNSGNIDSMVAHYTVALRKRSDDAYTAGGKAGARPDRAVTVYTKKLKSLFPDTPVAIGGLEASLRRFAHYDYWSDTVRESVLIESGADILMYGMGERHAVEIADRLRNGENISDLTDISGTCYAVKTTDYIPSAAAECPSYEIVKENTESGKRQYAIACKIQQNEQDAVRGKKIIQRHGDKILVQNKPSLPLNTEELDSVYALPFMRAYHPSYESKGGVPAFSEVKFSLTHNRGCYGACNFCSIAFHQGRYVTSRSHDSVIREAKLLTEQPDFKGYIHDVGGPTANFRAPSCEKQIKDGVCPSKKCLAPEICPNVKVDHSDYLELLKKLKRIPKVKKVFIRSGIRFDYLINDADEEFFRELVRDHVSGQLKVAPEHCSDRVLDCMGKPHIKTYESFKKRYYELSEKAGKKQYLVPYLMSSHPGSTVDDAVELARFIKKEGMHPEQVQDFYPTPGTVSTCMFYTGLNPFTMKPVYVPRTKEEKAEQRALLQYYLPENKEKVISALKRAGRYDLIGTGKNCLVTNDLHGKLKPKSNGKSKNVKKQKSKKKR